MQVNSDNENQELHPLHEEVKKKKRRKKQNNEEGDSIVDDGLSGCVFDGCYVLSWFPTDFDGGCLPDFDGCSNIGDGCSNIGDGCSIGDGCTMVFFLPFKLMVMLGLMLYGDWDFRHWKAKI